ncbi:peptidylprolyl isomerase [Chondromyces apiculatus]|uniref:PpiC domain-containing protein n=1 Tax=Chondromyces apiculatus DSM 436 TaxID=1192034 RepID=A0A017T5R2_9BACT|nr:peptidyl-prolyl cis-trans isomerase [Chondromyces apiculatus]EYF03926.1 Hypothetical protein CAP_5027 [Chondromyces apiculatus DSM 436]
MVLLFALVLAGAVGALVYGSRSYEVRDGSGPADAGADAVAIEDGGPIEDAGDAGAGGGPSEPEPGNPTGGGSGRSDAGVVLLSGEVPPPLAAEAPKRVRFGVILVQYRGSQGAAPSSRSREAALELARQIATEAAQDFKAALAKGDKGSTEDLGWMPRGVLEPAPEFVLFSLPKGGVGGPVDTPRGYWIVRRID